MKQIRVEALRRRQALGLTCAIIRPDGKPRVRLEIDQFIKNNEMTNLFLLALHDLMEEDWENPFSYFQIAGIHGKPYTPWNGIQPTAEGANTSAGYCSHSSVLFPTWHRAYLMMLEQAIYLKMVDRANEFPEAWRDLYLEAAHSFALPYWDPFLPRKRLKNVHGYFFYQTGLPVIMTIPKVLIRYPNSPSVLEEMDNPLARFIFPSAASHELRSRSTSRLSTSSRQVVSPATTSNSIAINSEDHTFEASKHILVPGAKPQIVSIAASKSAGSREGRQDAGARNLPEMGWEDLNTRLPNGQRYPPHMSQYTIRGLDPQGQPDIYFVNRSLDYALSHSTGRGVSLGGKLYRIFLGPQLTYTQVSNSAYDPKDHEDDTMNKQNSIEGFHNDLHVLIGAGPGKVFMGHMGLNEYAGFDPIFWLHHCNIDRIIALWQGLSPYSWFEKYGQPLAQPTFVSKEGESQDEDTPLYPFGRDALDRENPSDWRRWTWWTSKAVRNISDLGYTYPQLPSLGPGSEDEARRQIIREVNERLEWSTLGGIPPALDQAEVTPLLNMRTDEFERIEALPRSLRVDKRLAFHHHELLVRHKGRLSRIWRGATDWCRERLPGGVPRRYRHISGLIDSGRMFQWNVTVCVEKFALAGSFTVFLFLGDPCDDSASWPHDRNMIGSDSVFATTTREGCANCAAQHARRLLDADTVPLTPPLVSYWRTGEALNGLRVRSLHPADVVPFLRWNLQWRVVDQLGRVVDPWEIPELHRSLKIQVGSQVVTLPKTTYEAPRFSRETVHVEITNGKPGGRSFSHS